MGVHDAACAPSPDFAPIVQTLSYTVQTSTSNNERALDKAAGHRATKQGTHRDPFRTHSADRGPARHLGGGLAPAAPRAAQLHRPGPAHRGRRRRRAACVPGTRAGPQRRPAAALRRARRRAAPVAGPRACARGGRGAGRPGRVRRVGRRRVPPAVPAARWARGAGSAAGRGHRRGARVHRRAPRRGRRLGPAPGALPGARRLLPRRAHR